MQALINHLNNIKAGIDSAAGSTVVIELKLRLLAQGNEAFRNEVDKVISKSRNAGNEDRNRYWNCDLDVLCKSIIVVFGDKLTLEEKQAIEYFNRPRNNMLHANFVALMVVLGIVPEGQEISASGKRNIMKPGNIKQAIVRFEHNEGIKELNKRCTVADALLDKLLLLRESIIVERPSIDPKRL